MHDMSFKKNGNKEVLVSRKKKNFLTLCFFLFKLVHYIETYVDSRNVFTIRKLGLDLLLNFVDVMEDVCDDKVFDLANHVLDFSIFADEKVKLPSFQVRGKEEEKRKVF